MLDYLQSSNRLRIGLIGFKKFKKQADGFLGVHVLATYAVVKDVAPSKSMRKPVSSCHLQRQPYHDQQKRVHRMPRCACLKPWREKVLFFLAGIATLYHSVILPANIFWAFQSRSSSSELIS